MSDERRIVGWIDGKPYFDTSDKDADEDGGEALDLGVEREDAGNLEPMVIVPNNSALRLRRNAPQEGVAQ